jgi:hypothetical protein
MVQRLHFVSASTWGHGRTEGLGAMSDSREKKLGFVRRAVTWLATSAFGLAGTVLLLCWLMAYELEPGGGFAKIGLVLAIAAYCVDLVREEIAGRRSRARQAATGVSKSRHGSSMAKAA